MSTAVGHVVVRRSNVVIVLIATTVVDVVVEAGVVVDVVDVVDVAVVVVTFVVVAVEVLVVLVVVVVCAGTTAIPAGLTRPEVMTSSKFPPLRSERETLPVAESVQ